MKKIFTSLFIAALALTTAVSCDKNNETATEADGRELAVKFVADDVALSRTELDATGKKANWVDGDLCQIIYYKDNGSSWGTGWSQTSANATVTDGKATFSTSLWGSYNSITFYFVYPRMAGSGASFVVDSSTGTWDGFELPAEQTPTLTSFDGATDILVGQPVVYNSGNSLSFNVKFIRKSGLMRLHFAGIDDTIASQEVKSVTVAAQEGAVLAGESLSVNIDTTVDSTAADPYTITTTADSAPTNVLVADYSAQNITLADLQTTEANKGVWLSMLPSEINSLKVTIELKNGAKVEFAERATAGMAVKVNEITPITLTFDKAKGDKATSTTLATQVLTITNSDDGLTAAVADAEGNAIETDAVNEYGLTTSCKSGTYFAFSASSQYIRNANAIGDYITKITVTGQNASAGYRLNTATTPFSSNSGTSYTGTTTKSFTATEGIKYFNISKHNNKTGSVASITIEYIISTTVEL